MLAALVIGGRFLVNPILRFIARTDLREIFTAFALLLVIAICVLMESVGLSMALGTFMAGVLLADSEYRHELISDLEPFKGLLLGLFFIAVGMSVDFGVLRAQPLLILALVAGLLVVKIALLYLLSKFVDIPAASSCSLRCCCRRAANLPSSCLPPPRPRTCLRRKRPRCWSWW